MQAQGLLAALVAGHAADLVIDAVALSIVPVLEQLPADDKGMVQASHINTDDRDICTYCIDACCII